MKIGSAVGAVLLGISLGTAPVMALGSHDAAWSQLRKAKYATEYGKALPPIGYVGFCARNPADCQVQPGKVVPLAMTPERWTLLYQVNTYVNGKIAPVSDSDLFGQAEYWTYPADAGDCEDYVLLKKRYLQNLGFPASALLITVVLDEKNEGHAVLTVRTSAGDFVLDNRRNEIRRWSDLSYVYLKRQSQQDPRSWVSLAREKNNVNGQVAAGSRR
ncbi:MAG: transglutaminase-like cysteine peptidase [Hyphomicrobiales bacterium]